MKKAKEIYRDKLCNDEYCDELYDDDYCFFIFNYQPILNEFGNIIIQVDDEDWKGDSRVLYEQGGKYGYLQFGWGSCSGCDALQACESFDEIDLLIDRLHNSIKWFNNKKEAYKWFKNHDWEGDFSWYMEEQKEFRNKCEEFLLK